MSDRLDITTYQKILRRHLPYAGEEAMAGDSMLADLGLDSLGTVALLAELEGEFGMELPDEALTEGTFLTVDSLWQVFSETAGEPR